MGVRNILKGIRRVPIVRKVEESGRTEESGTVDERGIHAENIF